MVEPIFAPSVRPCTTCGARLDSEAALSVLACPYCGTEQHMRLERRVFDRDWEPQTPRELVVPFAVDQSEARRALREWARGRRFAPRRLRRLHRSESLTSVYLPHWVWEAEAHSRYTGERGRHHVVEDGRGNRFRRTRWHPVEGVMTCEFDDVVVPATTRAPRLLLAELMRDRPMESARPGPPDGHRVVRFDVDPEAGLAEAKLQMDELVVCEARDRVGGDAQRFHAVDTVYAGIGCRSLLLPVWTASYVFAGRPRQVLVSGWAGRVAGARPRSPWKIGAAFALPVVVTAVALIFWAMSV